MDFKPYSLVVTGEWPGAGQSTTAKLLEKELGLNRVYAGLLFRKFAHLWHTYQSKLSWQEFESQIRDQTIDLSRHSFKEANFSEENLKQFQLQLKHSTDPTLWDRIVDQESLQALQKPYVVVEAKIGVILDKITLFHLDPPPHPIIKILLTCPPEVTAERIIRRQVTIGEIKPLATDSEAYRRSIYTMQDELIKRHLRDWQRYQEIYGISRDDLYSPDIYQVETATRTESEVVSEIQTILQKVLTP